MKTRVAVCGALGKMGQEVVKTVVNDPDLELAGIADSQSKGGDTVQGVILNPNLADMLAAAKPDVCVDFTHPNCVRANALAIIAAGCRPVIGTTGLTEADLQDIATALTKARLGGIVAPNFAIGAVLLMKFAQEAARYLDHAEIIEYHHNQKADAPSGTAIKTAELMAQSQSRFGATNSAEKETYPGARGGKGPANIQIHSVRLPGLVAHQEVIFGAQGQMLTLRHDSIDRSSFMPGVAMACKRVMTVNGLIYGLEHLL